MNNIQDISWTNVMSWSPSGNLPWCAVNVTGLNKGYAPAIAGIWGREGGGGRRRLIQIKKCVLLFA